MPKYTIEFVCTCNGARGATGRMPIDADQIIPSVAFAQQNMTADITRAAADLSGDRITDLTITDVRPS